MALLDELLSRYSVSIQSMNQWLLIRFRWVTMLFLFVVTSSLALWGLRAPAWQRRLLLRQRKREMGRQELGEGDHWEGPSRLFLVVPCCLALHRAVLCGHKCKHLCLGLCSHGAGRCIGRERVCLPHDKTWLIWFPVCLFWVLLLLSCSYFAHATWLYSATLPYSAGELGSERRTWRKEKETISWW